MKVFMKAQGVWGAIEQKDPKVAVDERTVQICLLYTSDAADE